MSERKVPLVSHLTRCGFQRYKKNLKALYIVHATSFVRTVAMLLKPLMSVKFGRKLHFVKQLAELNEEFHVAQLDIPRDVKA